jgi:hypothetical protein
MTAISTQPPMLNVAEHTGDRAAAITDLNEAIAIYQRIGAAETVPTRAYLATLENDREDTPLSIRSIPEQDQ